MFTKEMMDALEADGKKLQQETGHDHGPDYGDPPDFARFGVCGDCAGMGAWMFEGREGWVVCDTCDGAGDARE